MLDPIFITTFGLCVAGAAIATGISKAVSFIILLSPFIRGKSMLDINIKLFTPRKELYWEIAKMGIPTLLRMSLMSVSTMVINHVAGSFSDSALAAASVSQKVMRLVGSGLMGLGQGFQPIAGYCRGAKKYSRVRKAFWTVSLMGAAVGIVLGGIMWLSAQRQSGSCEMNQGLNWKSKYWRPDWRHMRWTKKTMNSLKALTSISLVLNVSAGSTSTNTFGTSNCMGPWSRSCCF